ncbi:MAG: hypothetical protein ACJAWV_002856 [Flammeovirgaceae bacterium]|jgi:hypothetical protein
MKGFSFFVLALLSFCLIWNKGISQSNRGVSKKKTHKESVRKVILKNAYELTCQSAKTSCDNRHSFGYVEVKKLADNLENSLERLISVKSKAFLGKKKANALWDFRSKLYLLKLQLKASDSFCSNNPLPIPWKNYETSMVPFGDSVEVSEVNEKIAKLIRKTEKGLIKQEIEFKKMDSVRHRAYVSLFNQEKYYQEIRMKQELYKSITNFAESTEKLHLQYRIGFFKRLFKNKNYIDEARFSTKEFYKRKEIEFGNIPDSIDKDCLKSSGF